MAGVIIPDDEARHILPNIMEYPYSWQLWTLAVLYFIAATFAIYELVRSTTYHKLKIVSFRSIFLGLCGVTMILRGCLTAFNFAPWFSLLILYLAKALLVMEEREYMVHKRLYPAYAFLLGFLFCVLIAFCIAVTASWSWKDMRNYDQSSSAYNSAIFGLLNVMVAVFGYRTYKVLSKIAINSGKRSKVNRFVTVSVVYFVIFFSRTMWNLLYSVGANPLQTQIATWNTDDPTSRDYYFTATFVFYFVAEIVPTLVVIAAFHIYLPDRRAASGSLVHQPTHVTHHRTSRYSHQHHARLTDTESAAEKDATEYFGDSGKGVRGYGYDSIPQ